MLRFRNDDEKRAWDLYAAAAFSHPSTETSLDDEAKWASEGADRLLAQRRLRDPQCPDHIATQAE